jgi:hypothetical protein
MFGPILFVAVMTAPTPQPSATPALKTIVSVRASSRCAEMITHANSAIGTTLDNDAVVSKTITTLRLLNLDDGNPINRRKGFNALGDLAKKLMQQARAGDDEVKRLRKLAASEKTTNPDEAKAVKDFADELGGALWRQQKIARDLNGYLAYEDFRDMAQWDEGQQAMNRATFGVPDPLQQTPKGIPGSQDVAYGPNAGEPAPSRYMPPHLGHEPNQPTATEYARAAADDFQSRIPDIVSDESHAAGHIDGAFSRCSSE